MKLLILLFPIITFSQSPQDQFELLRQKHLGSLATDYFKAQMSKSDARTLLGNKIKGDYFVEVYYQAEQGVKFLVKGTEPFYERSLYSYEVNINTLLLPLSSSSNYKKIKNNVVVSQPEANRFSVSFKRGDKEYSYLLNVGKIGLVDQILYSIDGKKTFLIGLNWEKYNEVYAPNRIKTISYEQTRIVSSFVLEKISVK